jgi:hypothetical protein
MEVKNNIFTSLFRVFLNKYFLPEVNNLEENMKLSQSQSTEGSKPGASIGHSEPSYDRVSRLIKEVNNFFTFLGFLAVEYYCLDGLSFSGWNDLGYRIKIEPCVYLTREILGDFFMFMLYEKYMSSNIVELLQRRNSSELDSLSKKLFQLQGLGSAELKIPLEAFPDYSVLQTLINKSMAAKQRRSGGNRPMRSIQSPNSMDLAEPGAISSSISSDPKQVIDTAELHISGPKLESEGVRMERADIISATSRVSNASSTHNDRLKGDLLSNASGSHVRASSVNNSGIKGLTLRRKIEKMEKSRQLMDETKLFNTVLSDSGLAHNLLHQRPESLKLNKKQSKLGKSCKPKSTKLLSTLDVLTLEDQLTILDIINHRGVGRPFTKAINILKQIQFIESPLAKLECIYSCLSEAIRDVRDYYATVNRSLQNFFLLSKDNLQAIFTYIAVQARVASLPLQLLAVREFVLSKQIFDTDRVAGILASALDFIEESDSAC